MFNFGLTGFSLPDNLHIILGGKESFRRRWSVYNSNSIKMISEVGHEHAKLEKCSF